MIKMYKRRYIKKRARPLARRKLSRTPIKSKGQKKWSEGYNKNKKKGFGKKRALKTNYKYQTQKKFNWKEYLSKNRK